MGIGGSENVSQIVGAHLPDLCDNEFLEHLWLGGIHGQFPGKCPILIV